MIRQASVRSTSAPGTWIEHWPLVIRSEREASDSHLVELYGELDLNGEAVLTDELLRVEATDAKKIIVDLSGMEFVDSRGLNALCQAQARSSRDGDRLLFLRGHGQVEKIIDLTGLDSQLTFAD
jgi:anti-sigma B factor antagonist